MGRSLLARSRAPAACAALAAALAGCTAAGSSGPTVGGKTLAIYLGAPASLASNSRAQDVVDAAKLAFRQQQSQVSAYHVELFPLTADKLSSNARQAIGDTTHAIAYVGEVLPGGSGDSIGITNSQDLLQVSATDTAAALTQKTPAVPDSPNKYYESLSTYGRTFARVVPTTVQEAKALVTQMRSAGVSSLYVTGDASAYGRTIALSVRNAASAAGISVAPSQTGAGGVFFGGGSASAATASFNQAVASDPKVKLFAPSALDDDAFAAGLSPAAQRALFVSAPGVLPHQLAKAEPTFVSAFRTTYGHAPSTQAIFGYEAMSAVLAVLHEAESSANNRQTVVKDFFAIRNRGFLGTSYSIDAHGDTSIAPYVIEHVKASKLVPFRAIQG